MRMLRSKLSVVFHQEVNQIQVLINVIDGEDDVTRSVSSDGPARKKDER